MGELAGTPIAWVAQSKAVDNRYTRGAGFFGGIVGGGAFYGIYKFGKGIWNFGRVLLGFDDVKVFDDDKKEKKVQLIYDFEEIENEPSAEFQLAAYYALSQPYNKKINLYHESAALGFLSIPGHVEKAEYFRKFDPHISE